MAKLLVVLSVSGAYLERIWGGSRVVRGGLLVLRFGNAIRVDVWAGKTMRP
jgi:hypothetical protein